jgi:MoaA/NifB/PqqE/SkfB family radical SAM enzyme
MKYKIPKYSEDRSVDIGKKNLHKLKQGSGKLQFTGAYIHLTPLCNFKCFGCFTHARLLKRNRLTFSTIKRIVDFVKDRGGKTITFAGAGEPTLDPEFDIIVDYIVKNDLQTVLFTNLSTLKSKKQAKQYLLNGPVVGKLFTLHGNKYNKITNNPEAYNKAINGLELLLEAKKDIEKGNKKVTLAIDSFISKKNYMDLPELLRFCRRNKIIPFFEAFIELGQNERINKRMALTERALASLFKKLQEIDKEEFHINTPIYPWSRHYGQERCRKTTHMFCVKEDGNVYMCVCTLRKVGNIYADKDPYKMLEEIFNTKNSHLIDYLKCDTCSKRINPKYL